MNLQLTGKTVLITGASKGIGLDVPGQRQGELCQQRGGTGHGWGPTR